MVSSFRTDTPRIRYIWDAGSIYGWMFRLYGMHAQSIVNTHFLPNPIFKQSPPIALSSPFYNYRTPCTVSLTRAKINLSLIEPLLEQHLYLRNPVWPPSPSPPSAQPIRSDSISSPLTHFSRNERIVVFGNGFPPHRSPEKRASGRFCVHSPFNDPWQR